MLLRIWIKSMSSFCSKLFSVLRLRFLFGMTWWRLPKTCPWFSSPAWCLSATSNSKYPQLRDTYFSGHGGITCGCVDVSHLCAFAHSISFLQECQSICVLSFRTISKMFSGSWLPSNSFSANSVLYIVDFLTYYPVMLFFIYMPVSPCALFYVLTYLSISCVSSVYSVQDTIRSTLDAAVE